MLTNRRSVLTGLGSLALTVPATALLSGCTTSSVLAERQKVALLVPLSGQAAQLGQNMERAARLTAPKNDPFVDLIVLDTKSDAASAAAAAGEAMRRGAKLALGPVFRSETGSAANTLNGRIPLVAFTNDTTLANQGAFVFGLTPEQSVAAILGYAKGKGINSIAVVTQPGEASTQAAEAAQRLGSASGIRVTALVPGGQSGLAQKIRAASGGRLPGAVLLPGGGEALVADGNALKGSGMRLLGTEQWLGASLASHGAFEGAWFAAPAPSGTFSAAFAAQRAATPGILAGLAYDATNMARVLAASGDLNAAGVMRASGFDGALGRFRFRSDRRCERSMAILTFDKGAEKVIATSERA